MEVPRSVRKLMTLNGGRTYVYISAFIVNFDNFDYLPANVRELSKKWAVNGFSFMINAGFSKDTVLDCYTYLMKKLYSAEFRKFVDDNWILQEHSHNRGN